METEESALDLSKRIVELEEQCKWLKEGEIKLKEEVMKAKGVEEIMKGNYMKVKDKYVEMKKNLDSEKLKLREEDESISEKYWKLEESYRLLQIELKAAVHRKNGGGDEAAEKLRVAEAEAERLKRLLEERDGKIADLLEKVETFDKLQKEKSDEVESAQKALMALKKRLEEVEANNFELVKRIELLERVKRDMQGRISELERKMSEKVIKMLKEKMVAEAERKTFEEDSKKEIALLMKKNEALEKLKEMVEKLSRVNMEKDAEIGSILGEKMALKEHGQQMISEWDEIIKVLYQEKKTLEAQVERLQMEKNRLLLKREEDGISNLKREKSEEVSLKKIVDLEKENNEMKAKLSRANMEKDAEIKRILNEKITLEEEGQKMITERDEAIKVLYQENQTLEAQNKQLEMEKIRLVLKREEDVDSAHQAHLVSNVGGISGTTPAAQNIQGKIKIEKQAHVDRYSYRR